MEMANGISGGLDSTSSPVSTSSMSQGSAANAPVQTTETKEERSFRQSEVNEMIGKAKHEAVERDRRLRVEQPKYAEAKYSDAPVQTVQPQNQPHQQSAYNDPSESNVRRIASEEAQRMREGWQAESRQKQETEQAQRIVSNFWNKISSGKDKYQDFEKVTGDIEFARFPNTVQLLAEHVDNSADVLYELGKDRLKMAQLESLSYMSPKDAIIQAQRLANSIKENESAAKVRLPNEPLSQMRPSITGTDSGKVSHRDLRAKYRG